MNDVPHMRAALALASQGNGETWPNPSVGCVIVAHGRVIARARTATGGRPHAEPQALALAGTAARGATAYVTLEPCSHTGQTPPCADALIAAGIARVVIAITDPDPRVAGSGIARLRAAGVTVESGLLAEPARHVTAGFLSRIERHRPLVTLKLATTLDGRIATATGESQWITAPASRRAAHALRAEHDAIMVGTGTVLADNPSLTCRLPGARHRPLVRIVADTNLRTPLTFHLLTTAPTTPSWFLTAATDPTRRAGFTAAGATLIDCPPHEAGVNLPEALRQLAARGLTRLLVEGGGHLAAALLGHDLVDRIAWFHAPSVIGADGLAAIAPLALPSLAAAPHFHRVETHPCGPDMLTLLERRRP